MDYQVRLPVFEGPLDLLLHLIEREKLDISTVSLAVVTDQFLDHLHGIESVQAATLADFLTMAARLVWLKSRLLLPQPARPAEEVEEDPGEALARQLREYRRFKDAAQALQESAGGRRAYVRIAPAPELVRHLEAGTVGLPEFLAAAARALGAPPAGPGVGNVVVPFTLTVDDQIRLIGRLTSGCRPVTFQSLLQQFERHVTGQRRGIIAAEVVVTLLAVLELLKRRSIVATQECPFGEILITRVPGAEIPADGESCEAEQGCR
jgi:segregation and condensation protein A